MFLGRQVDDAITLYYRHILDHGERLSVDQLKDAFWDGWKAAAEAEREQLGIAWESRPARGQRIQARPRRGRAHLQPTGPAPRRAGRRPAEGRVHARARARVERPVLPRPRDPPARRRGELLPAVVDYKVKTTPLTQYKADHDFQPAVYLAGRWLEGDPAAEFCFAQIAKPGPRRKEIERVDRDHEQIDRPAARRARPHRASRATDRRLLRAVRAR